MRRQKYFPYVVLFSFLFILLSMPKSFKERVEGFAVSSISPLWLKAHYLGASPKKTINRKDSSDKTLKKIELENELLKAQADNFYEYLLFEQKIEQQIDRLKEVSKENTDDIYWNSFFRRRAEELKDILKINIQALPAKIVFREPSSWSSSVWINIGKKQNDNLGRLIISKNSPVVIGKNLIGLVEYVGYRSSRVRLITDSGLVPSVRAVRGSIQNRSLLNLVKSMKDHIHARKDLFDDEQEKEYFLNDLFMLTQKLTKENEDKYLAKGELYGASEPLWRSKGLTLKGVGFNYDYSDAEGEAKDLRSGKVIKDNLAIKSDPLLKEGDLLITTGMDGVFPKGLHVAIVSKIEDLNEGDFSYDIEAKPTAMNLNELEFVFVLPALEFEKK